MAKEMGKQEINESQKGVVGMILFFAAEEGSLLPKMKEKGHSVEGLGILITFADINEKKLEKVQAGLASVEKKKRKKKQ